LSADVIDLTDEREAPSPAITTKAQKSSPNRSKKLQTGSDMDVDEYSPVRPSKRESIKETRTSTHKGKERQSEPTGGNRGNKGQGQAQSGTPEKKLKGKVKSKVSAWIPHSYGVARCLTCVQTKSDVVSEMLSAHYEDVPTLGIQPPPDPSFAITRKELSTFYGGNQMTFIHTFKISKPGAPNSIIRHLVFPQPDLNPCVPRLPGQAGAMFSSSLNAEEEPFIKAMFAKEPGIGGLWKYLGEYKFNVCGNVPPQVFASQAQKVGSQNSSSSLHTHFGRRKTNGRSV
jgi:hypothetical protein